MPKNFAQIYHLFQRKPLKFQETFLDLLFFRRKVGKRTFAQIYHLFRRKLLKFQETFPEKFLVSGFGAEAPTFNAHKKHGIAVLFYFFVIICWNCRSKPCFKRLFVKSPLKIRKNFAPNTPLCFGESF